MTKARANGYGHKRNHPIDARIERLGQLNDRRLAANERGDIIELQQIALEYESLNRPCVTMAKEIRMAISVRWYPAGDREGVKINANQY